MTSGHILVIGGANSGKSAVAESIMRRLAADVGADCIYIATSVGLDDEMRDKIARHRRSRGPHWTTVESPLDLAGTLAARPGGSAVLIDCVTMWLSNHLLAGCDLDAVTAGLDSALGAAAAPVVLVSNEVGMGIVPDNALARRFRTAQGLLNRTLAARCGTVVGVMAGLPFPLKGPLPEALG
jgi:adenosylcobinamide kinase/adenosylcobinamide-phosphate guanylyltransferase